MCTEVYFKTERKIVGSIGELAEMVGGFDKIIPIDADDYPESHPLSACADECLCHIDIEATLKASVYNCVQDWDQFEYSAIKPAWLVEEERRATDRARYEAAMAEMRRDTDTHPKGRDAQQGSVHG